MLNRLSYSELVGYYNKLLPCFFLNFFHIICHRSQEISNLSEITQEMEEEAQGLKAMVREANTKLEVAISLFLNSIESEIYRKTDRYCDLEIIFILKNQTNEYQNTQNTYP